MIKSYEVIHMAFQLKPNKKETENIVLQACEYALDNMQTKKKDP